VAPASPIWLPERLKGCPEHTTTPHADRRSYSGIWWNRERRGGRKTAKVRTGDGSHLLQLRQRDVDSNRTSEAGGSRGADLVARKAKRVPPNTPHNPPGQEKLVHVHRAERWSEKRKGRDELFRTYNKAVNVALTRIASARLAAPAAPKRLPERLQGSQTHHKPRGRDA
jgi:hypothetical protein